MRTYAGEGVSWHRSGREEREVEEGKWTRLQPVEVERRRRGQVCKGSKISRWQRNDISTTTNARAKAKETQQPAPDRRPHRPSARARDSCWHWRRHAPEARRQGGGGEILPIRGTLRVESA